MSEHPPQVLGYATPVLLDSTVFWRDGKSVAAIRYAPFPARCIKCNAPAERRWRRTLYWTNPYCLLFLFIPVVGLLITVVVALFSRGSSRANPALCPEHRRLRWFHLLIGWGVGLAGVGNLMLGIYLNDVRRFRNSDLPTVLIVGGFVAIVGGMVWGRIFAHVIRMSWAKGQYVWYRGAGTPFLESLPPFVQPSASASRGFEVITR